MAAAGVQREKILKGGVHSLSYTNHKRLGQADAESPQEKGKKVVPNLIRVL